MQKQINVAVVCLTGILFCIPVSAQTIGQYSKAQKTLLEAEAARNTAKAFEAVNGGANPGKTSAGPLPSSTTVPLPSIEPSAPAPSRLAAATPLASRPAPPQRPQEIKVAGVFISKRKTVAEVIVGEQAHLLIQGQDVPKTKWRVQAISGHQVILQSQPGSGRAAQQVFKLPGV
jgi:hypothetical protein